MAFTFHQGTKPLLISFPHSSTFIPEAIGKRMTPEGLATSDTDWLLPRLYDFVAKEDLSTIEAGFSRYVIDPNRSTSGENLYPGRPTPELCPLQSFEGHDLYQVGQVPTRTDIEARTELFWQPYHQHIRTELDRLRSRHGIALLFDAHSILSHVPRLFEGQLPDINIGTASGKSCNPTLQQAISTRLEAQSAFSHVINGRFIGGYITRNYGEPARNIHAVQLELSQRCYLDEANGRWQDDKVGTIRPVLQSILEAMLHWAENQS